jgi:hypothetical protein
LAAKLSELLHPVNVCDAYGQVIGQFFPRLDPARFDLEPEISEEEIERRKNSNEPTYSTEEVLRYLERL